MKLMLGNGKVQKVMADNETVTRDYSEVLSTSGYKYLPNLIFENFIDCDEMAVALGITFDDLIKKLNAEDTFFIEEAEIIKSEYFPNLPMEYIFEKDIDLKKLAHELDTQVGELLLNVVNIDDIQMMTGRLSDDVENVDIEEFRYHYHEISHQLRVINSYLYYVSKDLTKNHKAIESLRDDLFQKVVKNNE